MLLARFIVHEDGFPLRYAALTFTGHFSTLSNGKVSLENKEGVMKENTTGPSRKLIPGLILLTAGLLVLTGCIYFVNVPPKASFTATPSSGTTPLEVNFDASASSDVDGTITSYLWDFGDTQTGSGVLVTHTFTVQTESKVFTVILTVTDDDGASDTAVKNISVEP